MNFMTPHLKDTNSPTKSFQNNKDNKMVIYVRVGKGEVMPQVLRNGGWAQQEIKFTAQ